MKQFFFFLISVCFLIFCLADVTLLPVEGSYFKFLSMLLILLAAPSQKRPVLCYTVFCDFLLLFTPFYTIGVAFFTIVHLLYVYGLIYEKGQQKMAFLLLPLAMVLSLLDLYSAALCYIVVFLAHIGTAWAKKANKAYKIGLLLFALCDCCTALSFLTANTAASRLIWILYVPSQILLTTAKPTFAISTGLLPRQTKYLHPYRLQKRK